MRHSKYFNLCLFICIYFLAACSQDKEQIIKNDSSEITQQKNTNPSAQGLKVYIDPVTGKFLDAPPKDSETKDKKSVTNNINQTNTQDTNTVIEEKESSTPGGGSYIKMPAP